MRDKSFATAHSFRIPCRLRRRQLLKRKIAIFDDLRPNGNRMSYQNFPTVNLRDLLASFWLWAATLTILRIFILIFSHAELGPDESQYWYWSTQLAAGYYSKPPLIAWAIAFTTSIFGNSEWAVRLSAPFFHMGAAAFLYYTAKLLYNERAAFWAGLGWLTMPGVILSGFLMTTDAPLLFFWAGALFFLFRLATSKAPTPLDYAALGAFIGFGFLSKYAMLYFVGAAILASVAVKPIRIVTVNKRVLITLAITLLIASPNIAWNAAHEFQTVSHTAANASWDGAMFNLKKFLSFIIDQFAVAGIIPFAVLLLAAAGLRKYASADWKMTALLVFALTPLVIVSAQAFITRAFANWAASAYPATMIITSVWLLRGRAVAFLQASVGLHLLFFAGFAVAITNLWVVDQIGLTPATKEIRGWRAQSAAIASMADGFDAIVIDDRDLMGAMLFYERNAPVEIVAIDPNNHVDTHYEAFKAFEPDRHKRMLFVTSLETDAHVNYRFKNIAPLGPKTVAIGDRFTRTYHLFDISGYTGKL